MKLEGNLASQRLGVKKHILVKSLGWDTIIKIDNLPVVDVSYLETPELIKSVQERVKTKKKIYRKHTYNVKSKRKPLMMYKVIEVVSKEDLLNLSAPKIIKKYNLKNLH